MLLYASHLTDFGLDTLGVVESSRQREQLPALVGSLVLGRLAMALLLWLPVVAAGLWLMPQPEGAILAASGALLLFRATNVRWALIGLERPGWVAASRACGELLTAIIIVAAVHAPGDLGSVPPAQVAGDALAALLVALALARLAGPLSLRWNGAAAMPVFRAAVPLVLHALLALLVFNSDLILLRTFRDAATVGLYAAAYTLVSFLSNLGVTYGTSLLPTLTRLVSDRAGMVELYHRSLVQAAAATLPLAVGGALVAGGMVELVFGEAYGASVRPLAILLATVPAVWVRVAAQMALVTAGRQRDVLTVTVIAAIVTVIGGLAAIPRWGMIGAAVVTLAAELLRLVLTLGLAARAGLPLPAPGRFVRPAVAVAAMGLAVSQLTALPVLLAIGSGAAVYAVGLVLTGAIRLQGGGLPQLRL